MFGEENLYVDLRYRLFVGTVLKTVNGVIKIACCTCVGSVWSRNLRSVREADHTCNDWLFDSQIEAETKGWNLSG